MSEEADDHARAVRHLGWLDPERPEHDQGPNPPLHVSACPADSSCKPQEGQQAALRPRRTVGTYGEPAEIADSF